jgi:tetratricopeptide (TPR) repeat protein
MGRLKTTEFRRRRAAALSFLVAASFGLSACADLAWPTADSLRAGPGDETQAVETDYERGKGELTTGRLGLAVRHFLAALDQAPKSVEALNGLGAAFDRLGRFDLSARAYGRALAVDPDAVQTLNNMGYSFYLQGRYELAISYLRNAASRAGAGALTQENHRLAVLALARAGGPLPRSPDLAPASVEVPHRPYIRRAGKAVRDLVTKQPEAARSVSGSASPHSDLLPAFVAAPMAIEGTWASSPALGAVRKFSLPSN